MQKWILGASIITNLLLIIAFLFLINHMGGFRYFFHKVNNRGLTGQYLHRKDLFEKMSLDRGKIIFLGNSLTEQCEWAELFANPEIYNRGIAGDGTQGVLDRLDPIIASQPRQIFLMIGINDLLFIKKEEILTNYKKILSRLKSDTANTEVIVQSLLPVNNSIRRVGIPNGEIIDLNTKIEQLASEFGYEYVDLHSLMKDETNALKSSFTEDGIHLNAEAYLVWKKAISNRIHPRTSEVK